MIDLYVRYAQTVFTRFKGLVKYWLTINEINILLHQPFVGGGIVFEEEENQEEIKYQAAHHQLVASAIATKIAHEIDPENKVGCMLAGGNNYPYTCRPEDYQEAIQRDREGYFFLDVQARGKYPSYALKKFEREQLTIHERSVPTLRTMNILQEIFLEPLKIHIYLQQTGAGKSIL